MGLATAGWWGRRTEGPLDRMRYAIFSDVHANRQAWDAVHADALRQGVDTFVCLGDVVGYGPRPQEVLRSVREATPNFVLGNHDAAACGRLDPAIFNDRARAVIEWTRDRLDDESLEFLEHLPLEMSGSGIQFVHATVRNPGEFGYVDGIAAASESLAAMTQPLAFIGHTHLPLAFVMPRRGGSADQLPPLDFKVERGKRYLVNVGSVGEPRTTDVRASYVIYDDVGKEVVFRKVSFDVSEYVADLEETGLAIRPYFVQVVDAGMVAGATQSSAEMAPQLALAQLPPASQSVEGRQGRLVLGAAGELSSHASGMAVPVAQPKSVPGWALGAVGAVVLLVVAAVAAVALKKDAPPLAPADPGRASPASQIESPEPRTTPEPPTGALVAKAVRGVSERSDPRAPEPDRPEDPDLPPPPREEKPPEKLSENLAGYWSFDARTGSSSRFERQPDGSVWENLIPERNQPVHFLVPTEDLGSSWTAPRFDTSGWLTGQNGVGYEGQRAEFATHLSTRLPGGPRPASVFVRIPFEVDDPEDYAGLALYMRYDDAFYCYLNGRPAFAASENSPAPRNLQWNSAAVSPRDDQEAGTPKLFKVSSRLRHLRKGLNVLAIHAMNYPGGRNGTNLGSSSDDMIVQARLVGLREDAEIPDESTPRFSEHDRPLEEDMLSESKVERVFGLFGDAGSFADEAIEIGDRDDFALAERSLSLSLWFTRDPETLDDQARRLVSAGAGNDEKAGWALWIMGGGAGTSFAISNGVSRAVTGGSRASIADGRWHHAAVTVDRASGKVALYLDGEIVDSDIRRSMLRDASIDSHSGLTIGGNSDGDQHHRGKLDDLAIWHRALLPEEVLEIYERGAGGEGLARLFSHDPG